VKTKTALKSIDFSRRYRQK